MSSDSPTSMPSDTTSALSSAATSDRPADNGLASAEVPATAVPEIPVTLLAPTDLAPADLAPADLDVKASEATDPATTTPVSPPNPLPPPPDTPPDTAPPNAIAISGIPSDLTTIALEPDADPEPSLTEATNAQVRLKAEDGKLWLILPLEDQAESAMGYSWAEIVQQLQQRLRGETRSWPEGTTVRLMARDRLLDTTQIQELGDVLNQANLRLKRVYTGRRQTAVAAATAGYSVEQMQVSHRSLLPPQAAAVPSALAEPMYVEMTLRSGVEIRHNGTVVVMGDMNPGSSIVAEGDILVWGRMRGTVHAGCQGNARATIMALQMEPAQIRIADFVARGPSNPPSQFFPEVAYVTPQGKISIARATDFSRPSLKP